MKKYAVTGIGNAIVDALGFVEDEFLHNSHYHKGSMTLIDAGEAPKLTALKYEKIHSGGSVANSIATIAMLGLKSAFIGRVGNDSYGEIFSDGLKKEGIDFYCKSKGEAGTTAKSFVLVTGDGQRTMRTYLGNASDIAEEIDEKAIADSDILYIEGYLWDSRKTIDSLNYAIDIAKKNKTLVAFTLSDAFCVERHHGDFLNLFKRADIIFSNEVEIKALLKMDVIDLDKISELVKTNPSLILVLTRSENGAVVFDGMNNGVFAQVPTKAVPAIDSTGAGDSFAAGFLYGLLQGFDLIKSVEIGNMIAGAVIQKLGARLEKEEIAKLKIT